MTGAMGYTFTSTKHSQNDQSGTKLIVEPVATRWTQNSASRLVRSKQNHSRETGDRVYLLDSSHRARCGKHTRLSQKDLAAVRSTQFSISGVELYNDVLLYIVNFSDELFFWIKFWKQI